MIRSLIPIQNECDTNKKKYIKTLSICYEGAKSEKKVWCVRVFPFLLYVDDVVSNEARARNNNGDDYIFNSWLVGGLALSHSLSLSLSLALALSFALSTITIFVCINFYITICVLDICATAAAASESRLCVLCCYCCSIVAVLLFLFFPFCRLCYFLCTKRVSVCVCVHTDIDIYMYWNVWPLPLVALKYLLLFSCLLLRSTVCSELDWHILFLSRASFADWKFFARLAHVLGNNSYCYIIAAVGAVAAAAAAAEVMATILFAHIIHMKLYCTNFL